MKQLDPNKLDRDDKEFLTGLQQILSAQDPKNIDLHFQLARSAKTGLDGLYFKRPAVFTLLSYGKPGLEALYSLAVSVDEHFPGIWPIVAISVVILQRPDLAEQQFFHSQGYLADGTYQAIRAKVAATCCDQALCVFARQLVSRIVHEYIGNPSGKILLGQLIMTSFSLFVDALDGKQVVDLIFKAIARGTLATSDKTCDDLDALIALDLPESRYQEYFQQNPALLDPLASSVVSLQRFGEMWVSDFVVRRLDDQYIFVEIERPQDNPFTDYPQPGGRLSHALGQILNWFAWIEDNASYAQSHGFPGIHSPLGLIVIGRNQDLLPSQVRMLRTLNDSLSPRIKICTYDEILLNAKNILRNLTTS